MEHRDSQRVQIRARLRLAFVLLGRRAALCPDHRGDLLGNKQAGDAEVDQLDVPVRAHHHVGRIQIAIDYEQTQVCI